MSREELVQGYASGRLSRRAFVKGLAALGVSGAAAVAYANALAVDRTPRAYAAVTDLDDLYPDQPVPEPAPESQPTPAAGAAQVNPTFAG